MGGINRARSIAVAAAVGVSLLAAAGTASAKEFRIAVSNSYIGNEWRVEMLDEVLSRFRRAYVVSPRIGRAPRLNRHRQVGVERLCDEAG